MTTNNQAIILPSSFFVEDGSFFRIRNIQLGYTLPKEFTEAVICPEIKIVFQCTKPVDKLQIQWILSRDYEQ